MLKRWRVSNFKSIGRLVDLELGPCTLIAGVNSAGKSTLIQSLLLVSQTLAARDPDTDIVLNGELVSLGTAADVWHAGSLSEQLKIGFDLLPSDTQSASRLALGTEIRVDSAFMIDNFRGPEAPAKARLLQTQVEITGDDSRRDHAAQVGERQRSPAVLRFGFGARQFESAAQRRGGFPILYASRQVIQEWEQHMYTQPLARHQFELSRLNRAQIQAAQFLPRGLLVRLARGEKDRALLMERYLEALRRRIPVPSSGQREPIPPALRSEIARLVRQYDRSLRFDGRFYQDYVALTHALDETVGRRLYGDLSAFARRWITSMTQEGEGGEEGDAEPLPESISYAVEAIREFFTRRMVYIPALRAEPKLVWSLDERDTWSILGVHGERLAQALFTFSSTPVRYWHPTSQYEDEAPLTKALCEWLGYLDLLDAIQVESLGKLGYKISATDSDVDRALDLTAVGLGVSQVLPILVAGLLAPAGAIILVEQPEVHLHPRAQSRLGDFLLGLARTGRQVVAETHSEHIVNRLFLRIAESESEPNDISPYVRVYFAEREPKGTMFRAVLPNDYGIIEEWPAGFLDEGTLEAQALLQASLRKRAQRLQSRRTQ